MLAPCSACGRPVSLDAKACPGCGKPTVSATKNTNAASLALLCVVAAVGIWFAFMRC